MTPDPPSVSGRLVPPRPPGRLWNPSLVTLLIAGILVAFFSGHFLREGWDVYSYLATIRSLGATGEDPGRYANPVYVLVAAIHRRFDADPIHLLAVLAAMNACLFLAAARLFFRLHFSAPTVSYILFSMLFLWGRLLWSGAYSLMDAYTYFYPQGMAYSFLLLSLYLLHRASDRSAYFIPLIVTQALLFVTHIGTSLYYWVVIVIYFAVFRKRVNRKFALRFGFVTLVSYALALLWPSYNYTENVGIFLQRLGGSFTSVETAVVQLSIVACATALFFTQRAALLRRFVLWVLIVLPLFSPNGPRLIDIFGFGIVGIPGLLLLVQERKLFFPIWWCAGAILFTLGFIDPTRIILASSFALFAGAGVALTRFFAKPRGLYQWGFVIAVLAGGDLYFARNWASPGGTSSVVAGLATIAIVAILIRAVRFALPVALLLLLAVPLAIKWNEIHCIPTIEPKLFIEDHVSQRESVLVVEPSKRGMNKVIGGMQGRKGIFVGSEADSLPFYVEKFDTPFVLFYNVEVADVGTGYDILARDQDSALLRLHRNGPREGLTHEP